MGAATSRGVECLAKEGFLNGERVFHGLPHPGKEASEHTAYFLGEKELGDLSGATIANKVDAARDNLRKAIAALCRGFTSRRRWGAPNASMFRGAPAEWAFKARNEHAP
ncbi:hypothetical protein GCT13_23275 [Paraburkholderia sp. CNPSo 3157]|uniref:Uncharacterized protein n=1 Tax=Paraburkholderia franconis TaxID=2654983 RepID=A0A7X1THV1_9BURK|nr:hypothetical protein [Paraburkholderia franconis]